MKTARRARFWLETGLASLCGCLVVLTLLWRDWIEAVTGLSPDHHSGSFEWGFVAALALIGIVAGVFARMEWHHPGSAMVPSR